MAHMVRDAACCSFLFSEFGVLFKFPNRTCLGKGYNLFEDFDMSVLFAVVFMCKKFPIYKKVVPEMKRALFNP